MSHRDMSPRLVGAVLLISLFAACSPRSGAAAPADTGGSLFRMGTLGATPAASAAASRGLPDFAGLVQQVGTAVVNVQVVEKPSDDQGGDDQDDQGGGDQGGGDQGGGDQGDQGGDQDNPFGNFFRHFGIPAPQLQPRNEAPVRGIGSGFIISQNGYILTNAHVVNNATKVTVTLTDRREFEAKVVGMDMRTDIAVIKINPQANLPVVTIGNSNTLQPGQWVLAIGSPFGFQNTVTAGIVSATARAVNTGGYVPFIQTDVAVNPGNSGGPLFNLQGQVVGINSEIYSQTGAYEGISFAIPINVAVNVADQLVRTGHVVRGRIGVEIQQVTAATAENLGLTYPRGAVVASVEPGGPAEKAGIQPLDIILTVNGQQVTESDQLPSMIAEIRPGQIVHLQVWRDKQAIPVDVRVATLAESNEVASANTAPSGSANAHNIGLTVRTLTVAEKSQLKTRGEVVIIDATGPAADAGLASGDVILSINRLPISDIADFQRAIRASHQDWTLLVQREVNGMPQQLIFTISLQ